MESCRVFLFVSLGCGWNSPIGHQLYLVSVSGQTMGWEREGGRCCAGARPELYPFSLKHSSNNCQIFSSMAGGRTRQRKNKKKPFRSGDTHRSGQVSNFSLPWFTLPLVTFYVSDSVSTFYFPIFKTKRTKMNNEARGNSSMDWSTCYVCGLESRHCRVSQYYQKWTLGLRKHSTSGHCLKQS